MRLNPTISSLRKNADQSAFTLVEVLVAMVFMAIMVPIAMKAVQVASRAGQVAERKVRAAIIADRLLTEMTVVNGMQQNTQRGNVMEDGRSYSWRLNSSPWSENSLRLVTMEVNYAVQGVDYSVKLHTLFDSSGVTTNGVYLTQ